MLDIWIGRVRTGGLLSKENLFKYFDDNDYYYFKSIEDTYAIKNDILKLLDTYQI